MVPESGIWEVIGSLSPGLSVRGPQSAGIECGMLSPTGDSSRYNPCTLSVEPEKALEMPGARPEIVTIPDAEAVNSMIGMESTRALSLTQRRGAKC